jgi:hypothetical protein
LERVLGNSLQAHSRVVAALRTGRRAMDLNLSKQELDPSKGFWK